MFMQTPLRILLQEKGDTIHSISPKSSVIKSAQKMIQLGIGALLVLDKKKYLLGIISERDIVRKLVENKFNPVQTSVSEIMTTNLTIVSPTTTVEEAMRIVTEKRFRHLPVVEENQLIGLISIGDLTRWAIISQEQEIISLIDYISGPQKEE